MGQASSDFKANFKATVGVGGMPRNALGGAEAGGRVPSPQRAAVTPGCEVGRARGSSHTCVGEGARRLTSVGSRGCGPSAEWSALSGP